MQTLSPTLLPDARRPASRSLQGPSAGPAAEGDAGTSRDGARASPGVRPSRPARGHALLRLRGTRSPRPRPGQARVRPHRLGAQDPGVQIRFSPSSRPCVYKVSVFTQQSLSRFQFLC